MVEVLVTVRVFVDGVKVEEIEENPLLENWASHFIGMLQRHPEMFERPHMIELDFGDGDYFRWGTDPAGMVIPIKIMLGPEPTAERPWWKFW